MAFLKRAETMAEPARKISPDQVHTVVGRESTFEGKLSFEGQVRIDGKFRGEINSKDVLVIGEGALVQGEVHVGVLILNGTIEGNVWAAQAIEAHSPGKIVGAIHTPSLLIDRGVVFEGTSHMLKSTTAAPPLAKV